MPAAVVRQYPEPLAPPPEITQAQNRHVRVMLPSRQANRWLHLAAVDGGHHGRAYRQGRQVPERREFLGRKKKSPLSPPPSGLGRSERSEPGRGKMPECTRHLAELRLRKRCILGG